MQAQQKSCSYFTSQQSNPSPVQDELPGQLPVRIKVERVQTELQMSFAKMISDYEIKLEKESFDPAQLSGNGAGSENLMLPTNVSSSNGVEQAMFVDEIEIGETTISSQFVDEDGMTTELSLNEERQQQDDDQSTDDQSQTTDEENQTGMSFKCEYCEAPFHNLRQLSNHRRNHQLEMCPICKKTIIARYLKEHIALNHPKSDALQQKRIHKCGQCEKLFYCKALLIDHQRNHQTKECPFCKQKIKLRSLNMHIARKHSVRVSEQESHSFVCDQCDKTFPTKPLLLDHQRDHVSKSCPTCGVTVLARCLKKHMARKHPNGELRVEKVPSFKCDQCGKLYVHKQSLNVHKSKHQQVDDGKRV